MVSLEELKAQIGVETQLHEGISEQIKQVSNERDAATKPLEDELGRLESELQEKTDEIADQIAEVEKPFEERISNLMDARSEQTPNMGKLRGLENKLSGYLGKRGFKLTGLALELAAQTPGIALAAYGLVTNDWKPFYGLVSVATLDVMYAFGNIVGIPLLYGGCVGMRNDQRVFNATFPEIKLTYRSCNELLSLIWQAKEV